MAATLLAAPLPKLAELPAEIQTILNKLPPLNVFRMTANVPQSFVPFTQMAQSLLQNGKFDPRLREIAILRVAYHTKAAYEWHQHAFLAEANDVSPEIIKTLKNEDPVSSLSPEENFICQVADELTLNATLSDKSFQKLFADYDLNKACELILVVGFFNMLSRFLNGTRVQIEATNPLKGHSSPLK